MAKALRAEPLALATVVKARGSTPRKAGARQFRGASGVSGGTVGGGAMEARVMDAMRLTLMDGAPRIIEVDLQGEPGELRDGVCGGKMTVWIGRLHPESEFELVNEVTMQLKEGRHVILNTHFAVESPISLHVRGGGSNCYTENLVPPPALLIVGAGHIGRALAGVLVKLDFCVAIQDDRKDWLIKEAFPARCTLEMDLAKAISRLEQWEGNRFVALVTRGYGQDVQALHLICRTKSFDYVGILGSKKRLATVMQACSEAKETLGDTLHAPIGIAIGAETPEEIAISIAGEMIRIRRTNP